MDLLQQGVTAERIALSVAVGVIAGVFPVIGLTTLLSFLAALAFRLNLVVVQIFNGISYPLQLLFMLPFIRLGQKIFGPEALELAPGELLAALRSQQAEVLGQLWGVTWKAIGAWILLAPLLTVALYGLLLPVTRRLAPGTSGLVGSVIRFGHDEEEHEIGE